MIKNMVVAVRRMLRCEGSEQIAEFKVRVDCALDIIDQLVLELESQEPKPTPMLPLIVDQGPRMSQSKKSSTVTIEELLKEGKVEKVPEYRVIVDEGRLVEITGLDLDAPLIVDNRHTTYKEAIGKPFTSGKIL